MFILSLLRILFMVYGFMLLIRILASWFPEWRSSHWLQFIAFYTDPYLNLFRKIIPPIGMFDFSALAALLVLNYIIQPFIMMFFIWLLR